MNFYDRNDIRSEVTATVFEPNLANQPFSQTRDDS